MAVSVGLRLGRSLFFYVGSFVFTLVLLQQGLLGASTKLSFCIEDDHNIV